MEPQWPLIGRDAELAQLLQHMRARRGTVILAGPPGVGKTRLAADCLAVAEAEGFMTFRVAATLAASDLPLGCFAPLLPELEPGADRGSTLRSIAAEIISRGARRPIALFVDDAHLLDDTSAVLTHQLSASGSVFVLASLRAGVPAPDPIVSLWKDGTGTRIDLAELTHAQVGELLTKVLGAPVSIATQHLLHDRSAGNVLFLREFVLAALDVGTLRKLDGVWHLPANLAVSSRLVELVEARLSGLPDASREGLELIALGEPLAYDLFVALVSEEVSISLERRDLIRVAPAGGNLEVRLTHPMYGEVLRASLPPSRGRSLYRLLAGAMSRVDTDRPDDILRLATWRLRGGGRSDPSMMLAAARRAWTLHDADLTEELARSALRSGPGFESELLLGTVLSVNGRAAEAERRFSELGDLATTDQERAALASARVTNLAFSLGSAELALTVAEAAEQQVNDQAARDEVTSHRASALLLSGRTGDAVATLTSILDRSDGQALVWAYRVAGYAAAARGATAEAVTYAERGHSVRRRVSMKVGMETSFDPSVFTAIEVLARSSAGDLADAERIATAAYERGVTDGSVEAQISMASPLCINAIARGRVATAVRWGRESVTLASIHGRGMLLRVGLGCLAEALALSGQVEDADHALRELDALEMPHVRFMDADIIRARAWTAVAGGDVVGARALLEESYALAVETENLVAAFTATHDLVRLGQPEYAGNCQELAERIEGPRAQARTAHAVALAERDADSLLATSHDLAAIGANLLAAEAAFDAAAAFKRAGHIRAATAAVRRAEELAANCEGARTPALTVSSRVRGTLTKRQLEIAMLAASGLSNKDIAARLSLSVRTVENKLHSVYEQLGVTGRSDLADAL